MISFKSLYDQGWLRIIQSVGYPSQNRSHFASKDIYSTGNDLAQQTDNQILQTDIGNGNDESLCGTLTLYDPSSTTFVKHFMTRTNSNNYAAYSPDDFVAGYLNTTSAINGVQFSFDSGSISTGTIKMYGVK